MQVLCSSQVAQNKLTKPVKQAIIKESTIQDAKADFRDELAELSTEDPNQAGIDTIDRDWLDDN